MAMVKVYFRKGRGQRTPGDLMTFDGLSHQEATDIGERLKAGSGAITIQASGKHARFNVADVARYEVIYTQ